MSNLPITSREYKLMLNVDRFKERKQGCEIFLGLIDFLITKEGGEITERQIKEEPRLTGYLDTPDLAMRQQGFSLRLREGTGATPDFQVNLKYRAPDRYLSAARDISSSKTDDIKFEEDILPPFVSKYSHSNTVKFDTKPDLDRMKQVIELFPGLAKLNINGNTPVTTIKNFIAVEVVRKLCKFRFGTAPAVKSSLSFWYLTRDENVWPLVAEFSFVYEASDQTDLDRLENFPIETVDGTDRFFSALRNQAGWLDPNGTTKTAFAIEVL